VPIEEEEIEEGGGGRGGGGGGEEEEEEEEVTAGQVVQPLGSRTRTLSTAQMSQHSFTATKIS
jgi:hypothetical protein